MRNSLNDHPTRPRAPRRRPASDSPAAGKVSARAPGAAAALLALAASAAPLGLAQAGVALEIPLWFAAPEGEVVENGTRYDIERDLGIDDEEVVGLRLHGERWDLRWQPIHAEGEGVIEFDETFLGLIPLGDGTARVQSRVDLDDWMLDWYPLALGPWQVGVAVRGLSGTLDAREGDTIGQEEVEAVFPQLASRLVWPLGSRWTLSAGGDWVDYEDDRVYSWNTGLEYAYGGLRLGLGYQLQRYDVAEGDDAVDITLDGATVHWGWEF